MPMKNPPHPGDFIRTEVIEPAGLSVTAPAAAMQVSRPALSSLLNGNADLSGDMALRIEKAFGVKMDTLMRMQASYDIAQTRKREKDIRVSPVPKPAAPRECWPRLPTAAIPPILTELAAKISRPLCEVCPNYAYLLATSDA